MRLKDYFIVSGFLLIFSNLMAQQLSETELAKLHPQFRTVVLNNSSDINIQSPSPTINALEKNNNGIELYGAIIYSTSPDALKAIGIKPNSVLSNFVTARVNAKEIMDLAKLASVNYITPGNTEYIDNDVASALSGANLLQNGYVNGTTYDGTGVIVCIIDTGIDWSHYDFRDPINPGKSRIINIWDQTITASGSENPPDGFTYGVEYSKAQIENELNGTITGFVREKDINGHGTHVAGTAAGNGSSNNPRKYIGMAPNADILIVKGGNGSFATSDLVDALTYAKKKADALGKPLVVNMSLGSDAGSHDGSDPKSIAVNSISGTGSCVVLSAGNSGGSKIHFNGTIPAGSTVNIVLTVSAYTTQSGTNNDNFGIDTWFDSNANISAYLLTPSGYYGTQNADGTNTKSTNDGAIYINNHIESSNNNREIYTDIYDAYTTTPPKSGSWILSFTNNSGIPVNYHSWLFDSAIGTNGTVTLNGGDKNYTLSNTANDAIIVGSYVSKWRWYSKDGYSYFYTGTDLSDNISSFSGNGPTRNGLQKPDITAPGQAIISSLSKDSSPAANKIISDNLHCVNQGTSMSTPVVTGSIALLLQQNPNLDASTIRSLITSTTNMDSYTGSSLPDYTWGYGKLDIYKAVVKSLNASFDNDWKIFTYDQWGSENEIAVAKNENLAIRFSPSFDGKLTGLFFHTASTIGLSGSLYAEIWGDSNGLPNTKLGNTVSLSQNEISKFSWNFINMLNSNVTVESGKDYHAVLYFTDGSATNFQCESNSSDNRSSIKNGSSWTPFNYDLRIRPVTTKDITALPVELASFTAHNQGDYIILSWKTATEENSFGFDVERKVVDEQGKILSNWSKEAFIKSSGSSTTIKNYSFVDKDMDTNGKYYYRLKMIDNNGTFKYSSVTEVAYNMPMKYFLSQNYPNPFNPNTVINYEIATAGNVIISVYDVLGNEVKTLIEEEKPAGKYKVEFNGSNLSSGVYFYELRSKDFVTSRKMLLLK